MHVTEMTIYDCYYLPPVLLPRDAGGERGDATVCRLSVCLSVLPSVRNV